MIFHWKAHTFSSENIKIYVSTAFYGLIHCASKVTDSPLPFPRNLGLFITFSCLFCSLPIFSQNFFPPSSSASSIVSAASQHWLPRVTSATLTGSPGSASCQVEENNQSFPLLTFANMFCQFICLCVYSRLYISGLENIYTCEQDFLAVYKWILLYLVTAFSFNLQSTRWSSTNWLTKWWSFIWVITWFGKFSRFAASNL